MSKICYKTVKCAVCGHEEKQLVTMSLYAHDSFLDGRICHAPTIIQVCPECGYAAYDISETKPEVKLYIQSEEYRKKRVKYRGRKILFPADFAIDICEHTNQPYNAAQFCLRAAWICDDAKGLSRLARRYRKRYIDHISKMETLSLQDYIQYLDVCRRARDFRRAKSVAWFLKNTITSRNEEVPKVIDYELSLCEKKDNGPHLISELDAYEKLNDCLQTNKKVI